ncbi:MAG TPA: hypothetical protein VKA38_14295, partial [Draconibacterium sp.]|nr:hypothetical protein [Draconibacterium sp.]
MPKKINCFIRYNGNTETQTTVDALNSSGWVDKVFVVSPESVQIENAETLACPHPYSTETIIKIAEKSSTAFSFLALNEGGLSLGQFAPERLLQVAENTGAAMVYADYYEIKNCSQLPHPVIDYQQGSLRDDFNFGPVQLFRSDVLHSFDEESFRQAGFYSLCLHASRAGEFIRIPEYLFTMKETDTRKSGE